MDSFTFGFMLGERKIIILMRKREKGGGEGGGGGGRGGRRGRKGGREGGREGDKQTLSLLKPYPKCLLLAGLLVIYDFLTKNIEKEKRE